MNIINKSGMVSSLNKIFQKIWRNFQSISCKSQYLTLLYYLYNFKNAFRFLLFSDWLQIFKTEKVLDLDIQFQ